MTKQVMMAASFGLALLSVQPVLADTEWDKLEADYERAHEKWGEAMEKVKGDGGMMAFNPAAMPPHPIEEFRSQFRAYAEKHKGTADALPALMHMLQGGFTIMGGKNKSVAWALSRLTDDHAGDAHLADHIGGVRPAVMSAGEDAVVEFLEAVAKKNPAREVKGSARLIMAEILYEGSPFAQMMGMADTPEARTKKKRAVKMLREVKTEFAGTEIADQADDFLFAIDHLQVGMKAPEIVGKDADGQDIRLSQFEGRVVAIVFWGTWCAPCMEMIPHERELMEEYSGKPFTFLGINADDTLAGFKKTMKKQKITWPTIYDGSPDVSKIAKKWRVRSFPMIYLIDHKGVIRNKHVIPFQLDSAISELVAKAVEEG